ncbi:hypothetical protein ACLBXJ_15550 [Methylobacterium mesophilicum]
MLFVYDIGDVIGLTLVVLTLCLLGLSKALEALRIRRVRRRS